MKVGLVVFFCFFVTPAHADLYKCISAGGGVTYSDTPCPVTTNATQKNSRVISTSKINTFNVSPDQVAKAQALAQKDIDAVNLRESMAKLNPEQRFRMLQDSNKARLETEGNSAVQGMVGSAKTAKRNMDSGDQTLSGQTSMRNTSQSDVATRFTARDNYQKNKIPGFITHEPSDTHARDIYRQEMRRQRLNDPNNRGQY